MGKVIFGMAMSLDGFIEDAAGSVKALYPDMAAMQETEAMQEAIRDTGAVVMGRRAFEMGDADAYADHYEFQVPIFVLTHRPPARLPKRNEKLFFTFVQDGIESAVAQAKAAAGEKKVTIIGGASTGQQALRAGLVDELHLDLRPVLLGGGLRLFEGLDDLIEMDILKISESPGVIHMQFGLR